MKSRGKKETDLILIGHVQHNTVKYFLNNNSFLPTNQPTNELTNYIFGKYFYLEY